MGAMVSPLGVVVLPLGVFLLLVGKRWLFWATVVATPFFFTVVIDTPWTEVSPLEYLGALYLLQRGMRLLLRQSFERLAIPKPLVYLGLFIAVAYISLVMPMVLEGKVDVVSVEAGYLEYERSVEPLALSRSNFTQIVFPTFMALMCVAWCSELEIDEIRARVVQLLQWLSIPVILSGIGYLVIGTFLGPDALERVFRWFAESADLSDTLSLQFRFNRFAGYPRPYSLAGEPGYTASYLCLAFGLYLGFRLFTVGKSSSLPSSPQLGWVLLLGLLGGASTTGYFGLVFILAGVWIAGVTGILQRDGRGVDGLVRPIGYLLGLLAVAYVVAYVVLDLSLFSLFLEEHVAKISEGKDSGRIRWQTVHYSVTEVFWKSPFLGVGYGSHRTAALSTSLLANTGLLGVAAFLWFNWAVFRRSLRVYRAAGASPIGTEAAALLLAYFGMFPVMLFGKSVVALAFGWYWLLVALMIANHRSFVLARSGDGVSVT